MDSLSDSLRAAERRLQVAQLAADADTLDELLDDRLVFTGPGGTLYTKADDLALQRSGRQRLTEVTEEDLRVVADGTTGVTFFLGTLSGAFEGQEFTARLRYTRTWVLGERGWRLLAAHVSDAPP
ncbi:nuclear transport factor 2 family protein [Hamadaea tsunoensis]|uniref:nuclear transport factor 2 family protein n=1 Tax=Hamadaea tsunoensis TaxID=53368 RepID=UPI00040BD6CC|nr:nuclear transport factor 2 family protein [Hamadaea tsunoensis]